MWDLGLLRPRVQVPYTVPPLRAVGISIRDLWSAGAIVQRGLLNLNEFRLALLARDQYADSRPATFEEIDRLGLLSPLAFIRGTSGKWFSTEPPPLTGIEFRDESEFVPWGTALDFLPRERTALFSPWQLLYAPFVRQYQFLDISLDLLLQGGEAVATVVDGYRASLEVLALARTRRHGAWLPTVLLLMRLQERYWPIVSGKRAWLQDPNTDELVDALVREWNVSSASEIEAQTGVGSDAARQLYAWLAGCARGLDPDASAYELRRLMTRLRQERVEADALRALDFYDAAATVRCYVAELTGELPPDADQIVRSPADVEPRPIERSRGQLGSALRRHGLYPHALHIIVEGATEYEFIGQLFEAIQNESLQDAGIAMTDIGGDKLEASQPMLEGFAIYANTVALLLDDENEVARVTRQLESQGTITNLDVYLMVPSFEEESFTISDLLEMVGRLGRRRGATLTLTEEIVEDAMKRSRSTKRPKGLASILQSLARQPRYGAVTFSKPELAGEMVQLVRTEIAGDPQWYGDGLQAQRPIVRWFVERPLRTAWSQRSALGGGTMPD